MLNKPNESDYDHLARHDLWWSSTNTVFGTHVVPNGDGTHEVVTAHRHPEASLDWARMDKRRYTHRNPNMLFLVQMTIRTRPRAQLPDDSPHWLRNENGDIVPLPGDSSWGLTDFSQPETQEMIAQEAYAIAKSGLYDGVMYDFWREYATSLWGHLTLQQEIDARVNIARRIRELAGDDFLIIGNSNRATLPRTGQYINGLFMETVGNRSFGYRPDEIVHIENTLMWAEDNLREPEVNCLEGWSIATEPLDSPKNLAWMRMFTTMSLTLSDGFVMFKGAGRGHSHYWYDFYDANLGQPVGEKGVQYNNEAGVYIREFDNGWAVYNRSSESHAIVLSEVAVAVATGKYDYIHEVQPMDGDIFLYRGNVTSVDPRGLLTTSWGSLKTPLRQQ